MVATQSNLLALWFFLGSVEDAVSKVTQAISGTVLAGLGLASNLLDLAAVYDGTAGCLNFLVTTFVLQTVLVFMSFILGSLGALAANVVVNSLHWIVTRENGAVELHCKVER